MYIKNIKICDFHILDFEVLFITVQKVETYKQQGQEALNRSPEFCVKLTYSYLLKAGHVTGDTWGGVNLGTRGII